MIRLASLFAVAALLPALPAHARLLDDQHEHDGFFLRFHLGGGSSEAKWKGGPTDLSMGGPASNFSFSLGGSIATNLILFGELTSVYGQNPDVIFEGERFRTENTTFSVAGFGPGLSYYFMPVNLYLSGSLLLMRAQTTGNGAIGETEQGLGFKVALGKEWWVSRDWGLGIAGFGTFANLPDHDADMSWTNFGLAFTATYN